jgi:hypothetical protein
LSSRRTADRRLRAAATPLYIASTRPAGASVRPARAIARGRARRIPASAAAERRRLLPGTGKGHAAPTRRVAVGKDPRGLDSVGARGFEPPTFCSQMRGTRSLPVAANCKYREIIRVSAMAFPALCSQKQRLRKISLAVARIPGHRDRLLSRQRSRRVALRIRRDCLRTLRARHSCARTDLERDPRRTRSAERFREHRLAIVHAHRARLPGRRWGGRSGRLRYVQRGVHRARGGPPLGGERGGGGRFPGHITFLTSPGSSSSGPASPRRRYTAPG